MSRPPNPLAVICKQLGINDVRAAAVAGVAPSAMRQALAEYGGEVEPGGAIDAYLRLAAAVGAVTKLAPARLALWVDAAHLDSLYYVPTFRRAHDFAELPATRGELRREVYRLKRTGLSLAEVAEHLQKGHVCTAEGMRLWRRTTVGNMMKLKRKRHDDDDVRLEPDPECVESWRSDLVELLAAEASPDAHFYRFGMMPPLERSGRLIFAAKRPVPACVRQWTLAGMAAVPWVRGYWGELSAQRVEAGAANPSPGALAGGAVVAQAQPVPGGESEQPEGQPDDEDQ